MNMKKFSSGYCSPLFYKSLSAVLLLMIVMAGYQCSASLRVATSDDEKRSGVPVDTLEKGRQLYIRSCGSCHTLYLPGKFTALQWENQVSRMQERSNITGEQKEVILKYLKTMTLR